MTKSENEINHVFLAVLDEYVSMQKNHVLALRGKGINALSGMLEQRYNVSRRLQQCLERFDPAALSAESETAELIRRKMNEIKWNEKKLVGLVAGQRDQVQGKICALRKGKNVLRGYSSNGAGPRPKFLSSRT